MAVEVVVLVAGVEAAAVAAEGAAVDLVVGPYHCGREKGRSEVYGSGRESHWKFLDLDREQMGYVLGQEWHTEVLCLELDLRR